MVNGMQLDEDWKFLIQFLPEGWEKKARELGAVTRQRKIISAEILLRILLIHLADGCSMRETVVRAREAHLADISDVALFKRLKASSEWLRWISVNLAENVHGITEKPPWLKDFNVRIIDASVISEPGSTGSDWRLHYSIELFGVITGINFRTFTGIIFPSPHNSGVTHRGRWDAERGGISFVKRHISTIPPSRRKDQLQRTRATHRV
jgi:hypothetical protein